MIRSFLVLLPFVLSVSPEPPSPSIVPWWLEARMAPPGAVFLRCGVAFCSGPSKTALDMRWVPGGTVEAGAITSIPLDADRSIALGLSGSVREALGVRFGLALAGGTAMEIQWPIVQHPAMPLRPVWRAGHTLDFGRGATGAVFAGWSPGRPPRVLLRAGRDGWAVAVGSGGMQVSRGHRRHRLSFRWQIGWMRAGIPWVGVITDSQWSKPPVEFPASPLWALDP